MLDVGYRIAVSVKYKDRKAINCSLLKRQFIKTSKRAAGVLNDNVFGWIFNKRTCEMECHLCNCRELRFLF